MTIKTQRLLARAKKIAKKGDIEEARKLYAAILEASPNNKEAKNGLLVLEQGRNQPKPSKSEVQSVFALYSNGQIQEALDSVETLIKDYPDEPLLYNISGACYKEIDKLEMACKSFETAVDLKPDYAEAQYNLGVTLRELGQVDAAIKSYEKALANQHAYPNAHNNLGQILLQSGQPDAAMDHFEWAVAYQPEFFEAHNNLGSSLLALGQVNTALTHYEKALEIKPDYQLARNNLGIAYQRLGEIDKAFKSFERAQTVKSDYAQAHYNLSVIKKYTKNDKQIVEMESLLSNKDLSQSDRIFICFALAKAYEHLGKKDELFKVLHEGNQLRKKELNYTIEKSENHNAIIEKLFNSNPKALSNQVSTIRPIFIVGMLRSGTSLVEQIISSHHEVYGAGELKNLRQIIIPILREHLTDDKKKLSEKTFLSIRQKYLESLSRFNASENVITDKWPLNFRSIGFILSAIPEAKIVHLKRDARAVCWSIYKHYFTDTGNGWAYNFEDLSEFYKLYSELMRFWHEMFPGKVYDISYEDLTTNQEDETRKLLEYCELEWDKNCLDFHKNKRTVETASVLQVQQKMYQGSSEVWKEYEEYLQPMIKALSS
jgi:tetratricopeptide (TPR) repeat protein